MPWTIALRVPLEQGQITMPSVRNEPLAIDGQVVAVVIIVQLAVLAGADGQHVARIAGDAGQGADRLQLAVLRVRGRCRA